MKTDTEKTVGTLRQGCKVGRNYYYKKEYMVISKRDSLQCKLLIKEEKIWEEF